MHHQSDSSNFMDQNFIEALTTSFLNSYSLLDSWQKTTEEGDMQPGEKVLDEWLQLLRTQQESAEDPGKSFATTPHEFVKHSFEALANVYETEVSKVFKMPKVGLTRFYQERMNRCTDEFNRLAMEMGQFMGMLVSPMEKACAELNKNLSGSPEPEGTADDPEKLYKDWINILEQRYQELFHSSEFIQTLHRVLSQYTSFQELHHRLSSDFLKFSPISSKDEFDEVARENYELKKEVGRMKKRLEALEKKIEGA